MTSFPDIPLDPVEERAAVVQLRALRRARKVLRWIEANPERVLAVGVLYLLGESWVRSRREKRASR